MTDEQREARIKEIMDNHRPAFEAFGVRMNEIRDETLAQAKAASIELMDAVVEKEAERVFSITPQPKTAERIMDRIMDEGAQCIVKMTRRMLREMFAGFGEDTVQ